MYAFFCNAHMTYQEKWMCWRPPFIAVPVPSVPCKESEHSCTVKPVYKGHSLEHANAALVSSCPLYTG